MAYSSNGTESVAPKAPPEEVEQTSAASNSPTSDGYSITFSDSLFSPNLNDDVWKSAATIPDSILDEDLFGPEDDDDYLFSVEDNYYNTLEGETSEEDDLSKETRPQSVEEENTDAHFPSIVTEMPTALSSDEDEDEASEEDKEGSELQLSENDEQPLLDGGVSSTPCEVPCPSASEGQATSREQNHRLAHVLAVHKLLKAGETSPQAARLRRWSADVDLPSADADVDELEKQMRSGLQLLDDLAHANSAEGEELKGIHEAYYNFTLTLFKDIKESSRTGSKAHEPISSNVGPEESLESQKEEISRQENLFEREILHYKATKRELEEVARQIEEASKSYRKPDVLEDVEIPKDITLSSSSEYVSEIRELQAELLKKQETLKELQREIQQSYLPKSLVDSVCESHRLAKQSLKEIEEETAYLKECISRMDLKYLYNLQTS